jgi:hypothetical protein
MLPGRGPPRPLAPLLWTASVGVLVVYLLVFGLSTLQHLSYPMELVYGEAVVLEEARRVGAGQALYPPPIDLPLTVTAYTPVYYVLVAWLQGATGDSGYTSGRLVSAAASLATAVLLVWSVRRVAGRWSGGLLAGGLFLTQNLTVLLWASLHRVDPLALCLSVAGLALATAGRPQLAVAPLVLAVMTKQTYLVAPLAVCVLLWPNWRALLTFIGLFGVGVFVALGVGQVATGGWLLWHTVVSNANPLNFVYFASMFGAFVQFNALPLCAAGALFALRASPIERLWRAYFLFAALEALVTIGKLGASSNYWLELTTATAALIGVLAVRLASSGPDARGPFSPTGLASVVLAALLISVPAYQATVAQMVDQRIAETLGRRTPQQQLAEAIATEPGELLTDDPSFAVLAGKHVQFEFIIFTLLATEGLWDEQPVLDAIAARRFSLVALIESLDEPSQPLISARWTEAVRQALRAAYTPAGVEAGYWLYRPLPQ